MSDPFASDPAVMRLEAQKRRDSALNWRDRRRSFARREPTPSSLGPCSACGGTEIAHEGYVWSCAECGELRMFPSWLREVHHV